MEVSIGKSPINGGFRIAMYYSRRGPGDGSSSLSDYRIGGLAGGTTTQLHQQRSYQDLIDTGDSNKIWSGWTTVKTSMKHSRTNGWMMQ